MSTASSIEIASEAQLVVTDLKVLPAPELQAPASSGASIASFADYAIEQAARDPSAMPRDSALLASPSQLSSKREACANKPLAVLIDLDPGRGAFDPYEANRPDPRLPRALARLRAEGIAVFWSSSLGPAFTDRLRALLVETGLDPEGSDKLLMMNSLDQRKQTRRAAIALTHCPIAILGDERADFDELYLYLRDPQAPVEPDTLIGAGWFLADPFPMDSADAGDRMGAQTGRIPETTTESN